MSEMEKGIEALHILAGIDLEIMIGGCTIATGVCHTLQVPE